MLSFARFKQGRISKSLNHGFFSAEFSRQGFPACLTLKDNFHTMSKQRLSVSSNKFAWWILTGMGGMFVAFAGFCVLWFFPLDKKVAVIETQVNAIDNKVTG